LTTAQVFNTLAYLTVLDLTSNAISNLKTGIFAGLNAVTTLILSGNMIDGQIDSNVLDPLLHLKFLYMKNCRIDSLPDNLFSALTLLTTLDLSGNSFRTIGASMFSPATAMATVRNIDLSSNAIQEVSAASFQYTLGLEFLKMQNNVIASLPTTTFVPCAGSMKALHLDNNFLSTLNFLPCTATTTCPNWNTLLLNGNHIAGLSSLQFASMLVLSYLSLNNNFVVTATAAMLPPATSVPLVLFLGDNAWDCCGLEWLRLLPGLQDPANVVCNRPELYAGQKLVETSGPVTICNTSLPSAPLAPIIGSVSSSAVSLTWAAAAGNSFAIDYYECYYKNAGASPTVFKCPGSQYPSRIDGGSMNLGVCKILPVANQGSLYINVNTLEPHLTYTFEIRAHNQLNGGTYGPFGAISNDVLTLTAAPSQPAPASLFAAKRSINVTLYAPTPPNGVITNYSVQLTSYADDSVLKTVWTSSLSGIVFDSLIPYYVYNISYYAYTSAGASRRSDITSVRLLEDIPGAPGAPIMVTVTSTAISVSWSAIPVPQANGIILKYTLMAKIGSATSFSTLSSANTLSFALTGLQPSQTVIFYVFAETAAGAGPNSQTASFTALAAAPSKPDVPSLSASNNSCLTANWTIPAQPNGVIIQYILFLTTNHAGNLLPENKSYSFGGSTLTAMVCALDAASTNQVSIQAFTALGGSVISDTTSVKLVDGPGRGTGASVYTTVGSTSFVATWLAPPIYTGDIVRYELYETKSDRVLPYYAAVMSTESKLLYSGASTSYTVTAMEPATKYYHQVFAFTSAGSTNASIEASVTTEDGVPSRTSQPSVSAIANTVKLSWNYPVTPLGSITKFSIFNLQAAIPTTALAATPNGNAPNITIMVTAGTTYEFAVAAHTTAGMSALSKSTVYVTPDAPSSSPIQTIVIVVSVAFVVILSVGFAYERHHRPRPNSSHSRVPSRPPTGRQSQQTHLSEERKTADRALTSLIAQNSRSGSVTIDGTTAEQAV